MTGGALAAKVDNLAGTSMVGRSDMPDWRATAQLLPGNALSGADCHQWDQSSRGALISANAV
jgi:hypothetical protein